MANIKIIVDGSLMDGHKVTFKAPCDCVSVEKLNVCYVENGTQKSRLFTMKDSHGNDLTGLGNLFSEGAYVDVVLDTNNGFAYLQNAGTNSYLEERLKTAGTPVDNLLSDRADLPLSARQGKILNDSLTADNAQAFQFAYDSESGKYGYKVKEADTDVFVPFSQGKIHIPSYHTEVGAGGWNYITLPFDVNDYSTLFINSITIVNTSSFTNTVKIMGDNDVDLYTTTSTVNNVSIDVSSQTTIKIYFALAGAKVTITDLLIE